MSTKQDILRTWENCWGQLSPEDRVRFLREPAVEALARSPRFYFVVLAIKRHQSPSDAVAWLKGLARSRSRGRHRVKGSANGRKAPSGPRRRARRKAPPARRASGGPVLDTGGSCGGPQRPRDARLHKRIGPTMKYGDDM